MFKDIEDSGLVLFGCGRMGSAILAGCLDAGLMPGAVWVVEPDPSDWLKDSGVLLNAGLPRRPAVVLIAVKPQIMTKALSELKVLGNGGSLIVSVAAGTRISVIEAALGTNTAVVRAMPNTPAAIGQGITAIIGNTKARAREFGLAETLLSSVGQVIRLEDEDQMDVVTAVSGSGPAYVFHLIEALAAAGVSQGLSADLAMALARATVAGAGALVESSADTTPARMRKDVTSPGGTTAAALEVLMDERTGFPALLRCAVAAAAERSRELGNV